MADTDSAVTEPEGTGTKQGEAQPAGESQGGKAPGDDWISKKQFIGALGDATRKTDALARELAELKAARAQPAPVKEPTKAELEQYVANGDLTRAQADGIWEKQVRAAARAEASQEAQNVYANAEYQRRVNTELEAYRELVPKAWEAGSPEYLKGVAEFHYLTGQLGYQQGPATELAALRAAFGPLETLRTSRTARRGPAEAHAETGGGRPEGEAGNGDDGKKLKLTTAQREYYEQGIKAKRYKNWTEVADELKYAKRA